MCGICGIFNLNGELVSTVLPQRRGSSRANWQHNQTHNITSPITYQAHFWHAQFDHSKRTLFAAIYTSLGCNFGCDFCMINIVNHIDNADDVNAADSRGMRFWSPEWVNRQMRKLANMGVRTLRISDEMFFLNRKYYAPILQQAIDEDFGFNTWK